MCSSTALWCQVQWLLAGSSLSHHAQKTHKTQKMSRAPESWVRTDGVMKLTLGLWWFTEGSHLWTSQPSLLFAKDEFKALMVTAGLGGLWAEQYHNCSFPRCSLLADNFSFSHRGAFKPDIPSRHRNTMSFHTRHPMMHKSTEPYGAETCCSVTHCKICLEWRAIPTHGLSRRILGGKKK